MLRRLEQEYGSPCAKPLYCSVDPRLYRPIDLAQKWNIGYLGTYSADRQPGLDELLIRPASVHASWRFIVAGPQYPKEVMWPANVTRVEHLPPSEHCRFYNSQRFTLNITRADMKAAGWSPSVRLFEAAACGTPMISDSWPGLEELFSPGKEILIANSAKDVEEFLRTLPPEQARSIGEAARRRVLQGHTAAHRAEELESYLGALTGRRLPVAVPA